MRNKDIRHKPPVVDKIFEILLSQPNLSSREIANKVGLTKDELLDMYGYIRKDENLQARLIRHSKYPEFTSTMSDLLTTDIGYIERLVRGATVYPLIIEIHLGEICNSNCKQCFSHGINYEEREAEQCPIREDALMGLLEECAQNGVKEIWFSGGKEPFMSPIAVRIIDRANKLGFQTRIYTNGELLDTDQKREVVLECSQIRFSVNATNTETYDRIHFIEDSSSPLALHSRAGHNVFGKVINNIKRLVELKKKKGATTKIAISQIIQPDNYMELTDFVRMGYELGVDSVQIRAESVGNLRYFKEEEKKSIMSQVSRILAAGNKGEYGNLELDLRGVTREELDSKKDQSQFLPGMKKPRECRAGILKRGVNPYGAVYHCEFASHPQQARIYKYLKLGNLNEKSFGEILKENIAKYPPLCSACQSHEYGLNITLKKLEDDLNYGIELDKQPFFKEGAKRSIALVGMGRWGSGPILDALFKAFPDSKIYGIARSNFQEQRERYRDTERVKIISAERYPRILRDSSIKVVIITTQPEFHYSLAKQALLAGKDVFVEKPFSKTIDEAKELIDIAKRHNRILMVGYEFMYDSNINILKKIIDSGVLGHVSDVELNMLNPLEGRKINKTSNAIEDLASHILSILQLLFRVKEVRRLKSTMDPSGEKGEISFKCNDMNVKIKVDRDFQEKQRNRTIVIRGSSLSIVLDYQNGRFALRGSDGNYIKKSDKRFPKILLEKRGSPKFSLENELKAFLDSVRQRTEPISSASSTLWVSEITHRAILLTNYKPTG